MGMKKMGDGTRGGSQTTGGGATRPSASDLAQIGLAALLASEDLLFRDPFAECLPSDR